jgi:hypothetical protein
MKSLVTVTGPNALSVYAAGATINNVAFIGQSGAATALNVYAPITLNAVTFTGFTSNALFGGYQALLSVNDLFSCSNATGLALARGGRIIADLTPNNTAVYLNGNYYGLAAYTGRGTINPLFAIGNLYTGVNLDKAAIIDIFNGYIQNNAYGLAATSDSTAFGNTNTITTNSTYDITVSDGALIKCPPLPPGS